MMEPIALDIHVHQIPIDPERLAGLPGVRWHADAGQIEVDGHKVAFASLFKPAALIEWLERQCDRAGLGLDSSAGLSPAARRDRVAAMGRLPQRWAARALCAGTRIGYAP